MKTIMFPIKLMCSNSVLFTLIRASQFGEQVKKMGGKYKNITLYFRFIRLFFISYCLHHSSKNYFLDCALFVQVSGGALTCISHDLFNHTCPWRETSMAPYIQHNGGFIAGFIVTATNRWSVKDRPVDETQGPVAVVDFIHYASTYIIFRHRFRKLKYTSL